VETVKLLDESKECYKKVRTEHEEVKAKQKQLNACIQSLPKRANWAKEHKRSAMEHKKD
jgi:hypothetical protein